ncbi:immune inhibitor A [soil metagenome]
MKFHKYFTPFYLFFLIVALAACRASGGAPVSPAAITPVPLPSRQANAQNIQPTTQPLDAATLRTFSTVDQLAKVIVPPRDLRDLTLRLNPEIAEIPQVVNNKTPDYQIGDQLTFWVHNMDTTSNISITAQLVYKTDVAYVWVEAGQTHELAAIKEAIDRFSQQSYPTEVAAFGSEFYPGIDNDPRLHILHTAGLGNGIAGYFSSADEYSKLANSFSNQKEMFYINLKWLNLTHDYTTYGTVLAHEFQHMVHWANDRNEETWINEGLSEYAQDVAGYATDLVFVNSFLNAPDTQLNTWNPDTSKNVAHYGSAYLFIHYLTQRFGPAVTKALVANPANGIEGVTEALSQVGHPQNFDSLFAEWVVANYANQPAGLGLKDVYGYRNLKLSTPTLDQTIDRYPTAIEQATVHNYATDYIKLQGAGNITIDFSGQTTTRLANTDAHSGKYSWWSNRDDDSDSALTRQFDLSKITPGAPVAMDVAMWWDIEKNYDYGYVEASRDGRKWSILPGQHTSTDNPSGNSFGPGYTGQSLAADGKTVQWQTEHFDLSAFAGGPVQIRFEYITDDATNGSGWLIDDLQIPALNYKTDFEQDVSSWQSDGWLLTDSQLTQNWSLQLLEFKGSELTAVQHATVDATGHAQIQVEALGSDRSAVLAISALAPVTTEPATYQLQIDPRK